MQNLLERRIPVVLIILPHVPLAPLNLYLLLVKRLSPKHQEGFIERPVAAVHKQQNRTVIRHTVGNPGLITAVERARIVP